MKRLTTSEFIQKAQEIHGNRYDYSLVEYETSHINVDIICKKHGVFQQSPCNHLKGGGCSLCNKVEARRFNVSTLIERGRQVHGDKYDYSRAVYVNAKTPVEIICKEHGLFWQTPEKHWIGRGCPKCAKNCKDTTESFIKKARRKHGQLYDYSLVEYVDQKTKVCIIDPKYGAFWQSPCGHLNGEGCPKRTCTRYSRPSQELVRALEEKFGKDDVKSEYKSKNYPWRVDAYVVSLDLYIELNAYWTHGGHWFDEMNPLDQKLLNLWQSKSSEAYRVAVKTWTKTDLRKKQHAETQGLNYLVFWDNDLTDFYEWYNSLD